VTAAARAGSHNAGATGATDTVAPGGGARAQPPVALYVHVPFCISVCPYCDFVVYAGADARGPRSRIGSFVAALLAELTLRADELDRRFGPPSRGGRHALASVYLGGGTPSLLSPGDLERLLGTVGARFGVAPGAEITLEANPGPRERGDARAWRAAGITRLSIGAQALDAASLAALGRRHRPADVVAAMAEARDAGIPSVSLDLLYDLPTQTVDGWAATLDGALALEPDHLSLYALTLDDPAAEGLAGPIGDHLPASPGALRWRARARSDQDDERAAEQYEHALGRLAELGWRGYEISNWARPGHESRHNLAYWERRPYEAAGPGAHAFDGVARRWNAARLDGYLAALAPEDGRAGGLPPGGAERLDEATATSERIVLALRTDRGIDAATAHDATVADALGWAAGHGLVERVDRDGTERIVLTSRGRLLSNEVFARLV
jgi:oxygen-independent coproporphyrinogen-3 oxidase